MPTSFISGGSLAPIENSPPGIQAIPSSAAAGDGALFATVGSNETGAVTVRGASAAVVALEYAIQAPAAPRNTNSMPTASRRFRRGGEGFRMFALFRDPM